MKANCKLLFKDFILSILAGISISIGCVSYLISNNTFIGSLVFCVGLFIILCFNFNLFTGKVCYIFENSSFYGIKLCVIWFGNLVGTTLSAILFRCTRLISLVERCRDIVNYKLSDDLISIFILAFFCNILIFVAVDGFKNNKHEIGKYLSIFFGVSIFVLCGFEHCVADMFYFAFAGSISIKTLLYLLIITLGNAVGGVLIPLIKKFITEKKVDLIDKEQDK